MGRTQTFISALVLIALLAAWYMHGPQIKAAYTKVNNAKSTNSTKAPAATGKVG